MAAQPFDKETANKLAEAFNNLSTETKKTLSDLAASVEAEKKMLDIAKQLGQVYKTQQDKLDEQLKGKNLQEQLQIKLEHSEKKLDELAQARINSFVKEKDILDQIQTTSAKLNFEQSKDPGSEQVKLLQNQLNEQKASLNLERQLLATSASQLELLKLKNIALNASINLLNVFKKGLQEAEKLLNKMGDLAGSLMTKLNMPTTIVGTFTKILDIFDQIDTAATNVRQKLHLG